MSEAIVYAGDFGRHESFTSPAATTDRIGIGKRLMVLGAGVHQIAGIRSAVNCGFDVITVDNVPANPGHGLAIQSVDISTTDTRAVLRAADQMAIDGIVTFASDVATATVAAVAHELGLPGLDPAVVVEATDKERFRQFQRRERLPGPRSTAFTDPEEAKHLAHSWGSAAIIKPADSSGSRGVRLVEDSHDWYEAAVDALAHSRSRRACIEDFVPGIEVGGDLFLTDGEVMAGMVTNKHRNGFLVAGHSLPSVLGQPRQQAVLDAVVHTCRRLGITTGPVNFDVMVECDKVVVLELSPRTGGNGIPELIRHSTGFDEYEATIRMAVGLPLPTYPNLQPRPCGSVVFGTPVGGVLRSVKMPTTLSHPERPVLAFYNRYSIGEAVPIFDHGGSSMGYVVFACRSESDYHEGVDKLPDVIELVLDPGGTT